MSAKPPFGGPARRGLRGQHRRGLPGGCWTPGRKSWVVGHGGSAGICHSDDPCLHCLVASDGTTPCPLPSLGHKQHPQGAGPSKTERGNPAKHGSVKGRGVQGDFPCRAWFLACQKPLTTLFHRIRHDGSLVWAYSGVWHEVKSAVGDDGRGADQDE